MALYAFAAPILPGKTEAWMTFSKQLEGEKKTEYVASRKRAGLTRETAFHQKTPMGDFVVVVLEAPHDPAGALMKVFESKDPFDLWFAKEVEQIHGISAADMAKMPPNQIGHDWHT